uniref:Uncharacterized protein n=1 Tax=Panagrellus redivivus TaxID=6233 RepID=A0A7E4UM49_PANRE
MEQNGMHALIVAVRMHPSCDVNKMTNLKSGNLYESKERMSSSTTATTRRAIASKNTIHLRNRGRSTGKDVRIPLISGTTTTTAPVVEVRDDSRLVLLHPSSVDRVIKVGPKRALDRKKHRHARPLAQHVHLHNLIGPVCPSKSKPVDFAVVGTNQPSDSHLLRIFNPLFSHLTAVHPKESNFFPHKSRHHP